MAIILLFSLSGCYTIGTVEIEVIKPAKIILPSSVKKLVLINNSIVIPNNKIENEIQKGLFSLDTAASQKMLQYVNSILNESPRFDTSIALKDIYFRNSANLLQPIKWNNVKQICSDNNAEALVSLEAFGIQDSIQIQHYFDGYAYNIAKSLTLIVNSMWRIYLADQNQIVEKRIFRDTLYFDQITRKQEYIEALTNKSTLEYFSDQMAYSGASEIADRMAPYWQPIQREFLIYASEPMRKAAKLAYADDWRGAAVIWRELTNSENKKLAAAACHNMALVCEVEGRLNLAVEWLNTSLKNYKMYPSENYLRQINARIDDAAKLNQQFGVE